VFFDQMCFFARRKVRTGVIDHAPLGVQRQARQTAYQIWENENLARERLPRPESTWYAARKRLFHPTIMGDSEMLAIKEETFEGTYPFTPQYYTANGFEMHFVDEGHGEPIVMLHGDPTWV
jgi:hypothetical protein